MKQCWQCQKEFEPTGRIDTKFCCEAHRTKFNNDKRKIEALYKKALKAIDELQVAADSESRFLNDDANSFLRRLAMIITDNS